jgi:hypothetical protein
MTEATRNQRFGRELHPSSPRARRSAIPTTIRVVSPGTEACDYESAFAIERPRNSTGSAEQWLRAVFEDAPRALRWFLIVGWTALTCRLRLRAAPSRVLGWQVEQATPDTALISVRAWVGLASYVAVAVDADEITLASFVHYAGPAASVARALWTGAIPLHERTLRYLLTSAARRNQHIGPSGATG